MPYKSEKAIKIAGTQYDRRIKLDDDDKESIRNKYFNHGQSMRSLSREYKVDRQVIKYTLFPNYKEAFYKANRERVKPEIDSETRNAYMRKHRHHKNEIYKKGLIEVEQQTK